MGKRTRTDTPDEYEFIAKKFKKLERKFLRARRKNNKRVPRTRRLSSSSSSSDSSSTSTSSGTSFPSQQQPLDEILTIEDVPTDVYGDPMPSTSAAGGRAPSWQPPAPVSAQPAVDACVAAVTDHGADHDTDHDAADVTSPDNSALPDPPHATHYLNEELMQLLGEDPTQKKVCGKDIQPDLAIRLQHITTMGLSREIRKELIDKYLPPANSALIDAPTLNAEVKAAVSEAVYKRDKVLEIKQKQTASAISSIAEALTLLLSSEQTSTDVVKLLMEAQKLLCDNQHADSIVRRNFVLHNIKKELKDQLQSTKIDKFLFSESLAETIKIAKAISKSGADMKPAPVRQAPKKPNKPQKNLNWRAPPQNYRPKGAPRKEPAPANKNRPENSSRPSSRPAPSHGRR